MTLKMGRSPPPIFISRGSRVAVSSPAEESVEHFWKEARRFERMFTRREFWDMLDENHLEDRL